MRQWTSHLQLGNPNFLAHQYKYLLPHTIGPLKSSKSVSARFIFASFRSLKLPDLPQLGPAFHVNFGRVQHFKLKQPLFQLQTMVTHRIYCLPYSCNIPSHEMPHQSTNFTLFRFSRGTSGQNVDKCLLPVTLSHFCVTKFTISCF